MKTSPQPNEPVPSSVSPLAPLARAKPLGVARRPSALFVTRQRQTNPWTRIFEPNNKVSPFLALLAIVLLMLGGVNSAQADLSVSCVGKKVTLLSRGKEMARLLIPADSDEEPAIDPQPELASVF